MRHAAALVLFCFVMACTSTYEPRRCPRVALLMEGGQPTLVRNGEHRPVGLVGGGAVDMLGENPTALAFAETHHQRNVVGFTAAMVGVAGILVAPIVVANSRNDDAGVRNGLSVVGGAFVLYAIGLGLTLSAQPYLYDAINAYNDGVAEPSAPGHKATEPTTPALRSTVAPETP